MSHSNDNQTSKAWYLAQLKPNSHRIAEANLSRQGFESFCPMAMETKRQRGKFIKAEKPLFPGYIFVQHDPEQGPWTPINSTRGVTRLVVFDAQGPRPVPLDLMENLFRRFGPNVQPEDSDLQPGQVVRLIEGPFADLLATVESVASKDRIWLLLDVLGKQTRVQSARQRIYA